MPRSDAGLDYLLELAGEELVYPGGWVARFEVWRVAATEARPHGIRYALTLHDPAGKRILGFDNAHAVERSSGRFRRRAVAHDHWHRDETDEGCPYAFVDAATLVADFFDAVERVLTERGVT